MSEIVDAAGGPLVPWASFAMTRRRLLQSLGTAGAGAALADLGAPARLGRLALTVARALDLEAPAAAAGLTKVVVTRPDDLLALVFRFTNLQVDTSGAHPRLVR